MRRKIKRKNGKFFRSFRKTQAFPFGFPLISEKWSLQCGYASFLHLECEWQSFLLVHRRLRSLKDGTRGGMSATQPQKFHAEDVNQCLHNTSGCHGVPNTNLSNFTFRLVDFGKVLCEETMITSFSLDCVHLRMSSRFIEFTFDLCGHCGLCVFVCHS